VIFDRVEATKSDYPKHWFLHMPGEPDVAGDEEVILPDHVYSYRGKLSAAWTSDPAGEQSVLSVGRAGAVLHTLLPIGATMVKRGGDGHQFWGHPNESTAQYNHVSRRSHLPPYVGWRLELAAEKGSLRDYFLNVIQVLDAGSAASVALVEDGEYKGVRIDVGEGLEILFAVSGQLRVRVKLSGETERVLGPTD
jgi:hypothetical protein